jgi:hypothetical protein
LGQVPGRPTLQYAGDTTLVEFYDLNCPFCRKAASDIADVIRADQGLKLILVSFPVLSVASIELPASFWTRPETQIPPGSAIPLETRSHVEPITEHVILLDDHIAFANATRNSLRLSGGTSTLRSAIPRWISTAEGIHHAREL